METEVSDDVKTETDACKTEPVVEPVKKGRGRKRKRPLEESVVESPGTKAVLEPETPIEPPPKKRSPKQLMGRRSVGRPKLNKPPVKKSPLKKTPVKLSPPKQKPGPKTLKQR